MPNFLVSGEMGNRNISGLQSLVHIISLVSNTCSLLQSWPPVRTHYLSTCAVHALTLLSGVQTDMLGLNIPAAQHGLHQFQLDQMASFLMHGGEHMVGCGRWIKNDFPPSRISLHSGIRPQWYVPLRLQRSVLLLKPFMKHLSEHVTGVCSSFLTALKYLCHKCA